MSFSVSYIYEVIDRYSRPLSTMARKTKVLERNMRGAQSKAKSLGNSISKLGTTVGAVGSTAAIGYAALFPIKEAVKFESIMADVNKVVDFQSPEEFKAFQNLIIDTGIELGKLPTQIGDIAFQGGKLVSKSDLPAFIAQVAKTAVAFDMLEGAAAESIASISNKMGLSQKATADMMDAVNFLADNTAAAGNKMIQIIARTSGTFKQVKMPPQLAAGWAAFADQIEVTPQLAASGINQMLAKMMQMPRQMKAMLVDPNKAVKDFLGKFAKMDEAKRAAAVFKTFGLESGRFVLKAVGNLQLLDTTMEKITRDTRFMGSMQRELTNKLGTTGVQLSRIWSSVISVAISAGDAFLPVLKDIAQIFIFIAKKVRAFTELMPEVSRFAIAFALITAVVIPLIAIIGAIALAVGSISVPVGIAIAAIVAGFSLIFALWSKIKFVVVLAVNIISGAFGALIGLIDSVGDAFFGLLDAIVTIASSIAETVSSIISGVAGAFMPIIQGLGGLFGMGDSISAEMIKSNTLNGSITVRGEGGASASRAQMETDMPGNLGFNMAGA